MKYEEGVPNTNTMPIYATVDKSKKTKCRVPKINNDETVENKKYIDVDKDINSICCNYANINANDTKDFPKLQIQEANIHPNNENQNYANLEFAQSLEHYENSKELLFKAGISVDEIKKILRAEPENSIKIDKNNTKLCNKCGHSCNRDPGSFKSNSKQDDYLMMEPTSKQNLSQELSNKLLRATQFPGYLPMHPVQNSNSITKHDMLRMRMNKEFGDKSSSTPSLTVSLKRLESDTQRVPGSAMLGINHSVSAANSPYLRRKVMGCINDYQNNSDILCNPLSRKRSNSADATKYFGDIDSVSGITGLTPFRPQGSADLHSQHLTVHPDHTESPNKNILECPPLQKHDVCERVSNLDKHSIAKKRDGDSNDILQNESFKEEQNSSIKMESSVNVRRSASVPCKSGHNRDSSSSNDSGVSIGSLRQRGWDFSEFELPLTTSMSTRRHYYAVQKSTFTHYSDCYHYSLPRRSKSVDPLRELTFQFQQIDVPLKSSSAEAEIPVCLTKRDPKSKY